MCIVPEKNHVSYLNVIWVSRGIARQNDLGHMSTIAWYNVSCVWEEWQASDQMATLIFLRFGFGHRILMCPDQNHVSWLLTQCDISSKRNHSITQCWAHVYRGLIQCFLCLGVAALKSHTQVRGQMSDDSISIGISYFGFGDRISMCIVSLIKIMLVVSRWYKFEEESHHSILGICLPSTMFSLFGGSSTEISHSGQRSDVRW